MHFSHHPVGWSLALAIAIFCIFFGIFYLPRKGRTWDFDPGGRMGEFEKHAERYQGLAKLILTLGTASAAFLINFLVNIDSTKFRSSYSIRLESAAPSVITWLSLSGACGLSFLLLQNLFYEDYVHAKYTENPKDSRETYTASRYAINLTLAACGFLYFVFAYVLAAMWMLH